MSKHNIFHAGLFLAALIAAGPMSSCKKVYDYIHDHPYAHDTLCQVTTLAIGPGYKVVYNAQGDPTDILQLVQFGQLEQHFRYDRWHRVTDFYIDYGPGGGNTLTNPDALIWEKYAYPFPGIITDTVLNGDSDDQTGPINDPPPVAPPGARIFVYKFNAAGKKIASAETTNLPHQPPLAFTPILYDAQGNKVLSNPAIIYDNTINVDRTNKVWQLVYDDYSQNNPALFPYSAVNQFGLPTSLPNLTGYYIDQFGFPPNYYPSPIPMEYACTLPKGPIDY